MGRVIAFSEFDSYFKVITKTDFTNATILDTNILVSLTYEVKSDFEEITTFIDSLLARNFQVFTTVNTKSEFLDFHRRLIMTEHLRDMLESSSRWKISSSVRAQIQVQSGQLKRSGQQFGDPVFSDRQLKKVKLAFSAGNHSGQLGWLKFCELVLTGKLDEVELALERNNIHYISQHEVKQSEYFHKKIDWPDAKRFAESTCLGLADSMIINTFQCSNFPFMVSADFDIGYAALSSGAIKDIVMPDSVAKKYRDFHFNETRVPTIA